MSTGACPIGDALGAPVEFQSLLEIKKRYGRDGITDFHEWGGFKLGSYTDDTQMSLATAVGCLKACQKWRDRRICDSVSVVYQCYLDWLESQNDPDQRRGPGNACLSALQSGKMGMIKEKIKVSSGNITKEMLYWPPDQTLTVGNDPFKGSSLNWIQNARKKRL